MFEIIVVTGIFFQLSKKILEPMGRLILALNCVKKGDFLKFPFLQILLLSIGPLDGSSAGLFLLFTLSIHGTTFFVEHIFQNTLMMHRALGSSDVPRTRAEQAASLSVKKRAGPAPCRHVR